MRVLQCRACREALLDEAALSAHSRNAAACTSWFVEEPLAWMTSSGQSGKLLCPKCAAKVGAWDWAGLRCSCGAWVAPGFQIAKSKVDSKATRRCRQASPTRDLSVSLHWLATSPPPCAVVVAGGDEVRREVEGSWLGRHVSEGRAAWLYPRDDEICAALDALEDRGVGPDRVAAGGGTSSAVRQAAASRAAVVFALSATPDPDILDVLEVAARTKRVLGIFVSDPGRPVSFEAHVFRRLDPGELNAGVVRTLVAWLHVALPGHGA